MNTVRLAINVALVAGVLSLAAWIGFGLGQARAQAKLAACQTKAADLQAASASAALAQAQRAASAATAAQAQLANKLQSNSQNLSTRASHERIAASTTGLACLRGPAMRLLNGAPGLHVNPATFATTSALAAHGTATSVASANVGNAQDAVTDVAVTNATVTDDAISDTAMVGWLFLAGNQFEACRARLDALIDWSVQALGATALPANEPPNRLSLALP